MAKSLKNKPKKEASSPKTDTGFKTETEESIDWKALAKDERTWKIIGTAMILFSIFLLISLFSYLSSWKQDQPIALQGLSSLFDTDPPAANAAGRLGALTAHFFFYRCFGVASFLVCTFFFVVGVNLLFRRRVFSIWRNLKYVTIGMLVSSVTLSFITSGAEFPYGGGVGDLINQRLNLAIGKLGTGAILFLSLAAYLIWQFNPKLKLPERKVKEEISEPEIGEEETSETTEEAVSDSTSKLGAAALAGMPWCGTMSFDTAGRTMMGLTSADMAKMISKLPYQPLAFGANCGVGASDLLRTLLGFAAAAPELPLIAKGNAGIPKYHDGHIHYDGTPDLMADYAILARDAGAKIIGGCCGTTPEHLKYMRDALESTPPGPRPSLEIIADKIGPFSSASDGTGDDAGPTRERSGRRRRL